jgi:N,N'-diacetyllegionaminate synthase
MTQMNSTSLFGTDRPRALVIAEAGVNHNGHLSVAHHLIDAAADSGADAVKFQTFSTELVVSADAATADYQAQRGAGQSQRDMVRALELAPSVWSELQAHATERGLQFVSTAFDRPSAELLVGLGVPFLKVPSGEIDNLGFLRWLAQLGKPLLISTGTADQAEVAAALEATTDAPERVLLHCVSAYPAPIEAANLLALPTMRAAFGVEVGWSDHTNGPISAIAAIALGATVLEKHITLDGNMTGPDHAASADPSVFAAYVAAIRAAERSLGTGTKKPDDVEADVRRAGRRSWHATRDLPVGRRIQPGDVVALRPATGLPPSVDIEGHLVIRELRRGEPVLADSISGSP